MAHRAGNDIDETAELSEVDLTSELIQATLTAFKPPAPNPELLLAKPRQAASELLDVKGESGIKAQTSPQSHTEDFK
jgi:hypothetical protein